VFWTLPVLPLCPMA